MSRHVSFHWLCQVIAPGLDFLGYADQRSLLLFDVIDAMPGLAHPTLTRAWTPTRSDGETLYALNQSQ